MKNIVKNVKIIGTGSYCPDKVYTNKYLEGLVDTTDLWIHQKLGIRERRIANDSQATSDLCFEAGRRAIQSSGLKKEDIDLIIVATATPDRLAPSTACFVQDKLEAYNSVAFDISAVCSGFLYAMSVASQFIASKAYENILVIGGDTFSKITDWKKRDCVFFGDGAGAVILSNSGDQNGFLTFNLFSDGRGKYNFTVPAGGSENPSSQNTLDKKMHFFQMNGKEVYETGIKVLPKAIMQILDHNGLKIDDVDYMIPHQPSIRILEETAKIIGLPFEKVMTNMNKYANTAGGTIPILFDELYKSNRIKKGNLLLFAAVGSGWTWGSSLYKWT